MKNLSQISVILMKHLSHFGHLRLAGMAPARTHIHTGPIVMSVSIEKAHLRARVF